MSDATKITDSLFGDLLSALSDTPYARLKAKLGREPSSEEFSAQLDRECVCRLNMPMRLRQLTLCLAHSAAVSSVCRSVGNAAPWSIQRH